MVKPAGAFLFLFALLMFAAPARAETAVCKDAKAAAQSFFEELDRELKTCMKDCGRERIPAQRDECQASCRNTHRQRKEIRKESVQIACAKPEAPPAPEPIAVNPPKPRHVTHDCFGPDGRRRKCDGQPHAGLHDDFNSEIETANPLGSQ
ncbi:MAG TPA: hypothetical protein VFV50_19165 [Bdellovibrionales bacterium]|nr:hypothetical protein [Bdellovibrionales bacterium]